MKNAPYNPRQIREQAREKLKANIKRAGLLTAVIWNRRSGHLVGGHQRLSILDSLMRTEDYLLPVDVVDLDDKEEKAQVVALNNPDICGEWDLVKMEELVRGGLDIEGAGLEVGDVAAVLGLDCLSGQEAPKLEELAEQLREAQALHDRIKEASADTNSADFYRVVVFKNWRAGEWLSELLGESRRMFLSGDALRAKWEAMANGGAADNS